MSNPSSDVSVGARGTVIFFSGLAIIVAGLAVVGWLANIPVLTTLGWERSVTSFNPALAVAVLSVAGLATILTKPTLPRQLVVDAVSLLVLAVSFATILEYGFGLDFGIDQALVLEPAGPGVYIPGRMAPAAALSLFLLSISIILNNRRVGAWLSQFSSGASMLVCSIAAIAWIFDPNAFFGFIEFARLGLGTAISLTALTVAVLAVPHSRAAGHVIWSNVPGGYMGRRLLVLALGLPPIFAVIVHRGEMVGWYSADLSLGFLTVSFIALFVPSTLYLAAAANRLSKNVEDNSRKNKDLATQLTAVIEAMPVGVLVIDAADRRPLQINRRYLEICGEPVSDAMPGVFSRISSLVREDGEPYPMDKLPQEIAISQKQEAIAHDIVAVRPDGSRSNLKIHAQPALDKGGRVIAVVTIIEDITGERDVQRQRTEYVSVISHQLKSPLTSIRWIMESVLGGDYGAVSNEQQDAVRQALVSAERMIALVKDLLSASRVESGHLESKPRWIVAADFIDDVVREMEPNAAAKKVIVKVDNHSTRRLYADPANLEQVVSNLLSNAVKYSPEGSVVEFAVRDEDNHVLVEVKDRGIGIPPEQAPRVFSKFFRTDNARRTNVEGTGLGLYVCKSIVEALGGRISFVSDLGRGSTFMFTVPFEPAKGPPEPASPALPPPPPPSPQGK